MKGGMGDEETARPQDNVLCIIDDVLQAMCCIRRDRMTARPVTVPCALSLASFAVKVRGSGFKVQGSQRVQSLILNNFNNYSN